MAVQSREGGSATQVKDDTVWFATVDANSGATRRLARHTYVRRSVISSMSSSAATTRQAVFRSGWFWAWAVVGFAGALSIVSFIGLLLIVPVLVAAWFMASRPAARRSAKGLITGVGALMLFIAFVQRSGDDVNPLPWAVGGVALFVVGIVAQLRNWPEEWV